jgi:hypothetical protein
MTTTVFAVVAALVVIGIGGNTWLLVQETQGSGTGKPWNTRVLQWISFVSTMLILGTFVAARPWYWDLALGIVVVAALYGVSRSIDILWARPRTSRRSSFFLSATAVVLGSLLLGLAGVAGVLDGAALSGSNPVLRYHGGPVLANPVLYQIFWGPAWNGRSTPPSLQEAVEFSNELSGSDWAHAVEDSHFGVRSFRSGGCWIDPTRPETPGVPASSTVAGVFPNELRAALRGHHRLIPCPRSNSAASIPAILPEDAVVALWLPPSIPYELGGVSAHRSVAWPGRPHGLAVTGLPGAYAFWDAPACSTVTTCRSLPSYAAPTYTLSHELVESATDPYANGWFANAPLRWTARYVLGNGPPSLFGTAPVYPGEVADLCEPGGVSTPGSKLVGQLNIGGLPATPFYRLGVGCFAP